MGSLDVQEAKAQFLLLIDKVNGTHLPGFAIWLDSKLAEYKVQGVINADDERASAQQYPDWISRSLRQNLSFIFQGEKASTPLGLSSPVPERPKSVAKRKLFTQPEGSSNPKFQRFSSTNSDNALSISREVDRAEAKAIEDVIKLELSSDEDNGIKVDQSTTQGGLNCSINRPGIAETPMPLLGQTYSLQSSVASAFPSDPSTNAFDPSNLYPATSSQAATTQYIAVSSPAAPYQHPTHSSIGEHSVQVKSNLESNMSVATGGDSSALGHVENRAAASSEPGNVSVRRLGPGIFRGATQRPTFLSSNRELKSGRQCPVCKKTFNQTYYLKVHMRCHTGERPYACRVCGKRFAQSSSCYDHERRMHKAAVPAKT